MSTIASTVTSQGYERATKKHKKLESTKAEASDGEDSISAGESKREWDGSRACDRVNGDS